MNVFSFFKRIFPHTLKQPAKHKKRSLVKDRLKHLPVMIKSLFWFFTGVILALFLLISFVFIVSRKAYEGVIYPGIMVNGVNFGGKKESDVQAFFAKKNEKVAETKFIFSAEGESVTLFARELNFGYDENLLAKQAYTIGRSDDILANISLVFQAYLNGISLPAAYRYSETDLEKKLDPLIERVHIEPVDALFTFQNGKVTAFRPSKEGRNIDIAVAKNDLSSKMTIVMARETPQTFTIRLPLKTINPKITTDKANSFGIKELIASGTSLFQGSIPNRIYNITLAATRINGILIEPNEEFSFNKALGDVSSFTGYKQAYVISGGKTILGDGGGVCQVSTTFFRALLNAGLPITERSAHAYRVGYYEQDSPPGFDATIYVPSVDLKFKNDTGNYILIQSVIDPDSQRLTIMFYGTKDNRQITISKPVITAQTAAPPPLYQDDQTLPKGVVKQVDFAAPGASVLFTREVVKDGKVIISDTFNSRYRPWQAVYLRGTKE